MAHVSTQKISLAGFLITLGIVFGDIGTSPLYVFQAITGGGKHISEPFILGADRLGLQTDLCWAVEDAPGGVTSAKEAGCTVAGVLTTHTREELPHADHHLEHLNQLLGKAGL